MKERALTLTVVNPHVDAPVEASIALYGDAHIAGVREIVLTHEDIHTHNTFERPDAVTLRAPKSASTSGTTFVHTFPPASVTRLDVTLG